MADATAVVDPLSSLPIPPLNPSIFSDDLTFPDDFFSFDYDDLGITFDDEQHPSDDVQFLNSTFNQSNPFDLLSSDPEFINSVPDPNTVVDTASRNLLGDNLSGNQASDGSGFVNFPSPDDSVAVIVDETVDSVRISDTSCSELRNENPVSSQGSGTSGSAGSEAAVICSSLDYCRYSAVKRKNESCNANSECRTIKHQRSNQQLNEGSTTTEITNQVNGENEKKKSRLIRNRESAQLSRQRKKQYVEDLEDKVRAMHATIQDLNARVSYFAAENATLKQQMVASGAGAGAGVCLPPVMAPMGYPWMTWPPYVVKSHGSQVPLVPIPRLKTDVKKTEGTSKTKTKTKTKKVASISFIGLLLFIVLFGGLVPIMNMKFGGVITDGGNSVKVSDYKFNNQNHRGKVLMSDGYVNGTNFNGSEPLVASLFVPRNDKLVKIDGSLIINSVIASEKAMAFRKKQEVSLDLVPAIPVPKRNNGRQPHMYSGHPRALPSNEENLQYKHVDGKPQQWFREGLSGLMLSSGMCTEVFQFDASVAAASGAIVPATSAVNVTATKHRHNSTQITTVKNRRILHSLPIPLSDSTTNITKEQVTGHDSKNKDRHENKSVSSMVVSVLVDPREAGDGGDLDGMMGGGGGGGKGNSFSRIFVVVLLDSVKYVTYSCMLPLKGGSHLVTA